MIFISFSLKFLGKLNNTEDSIELFNFALNSDPLKSVLSFSYFVLCFGPKRGPKGEQFRD